MITIVTITYNNLPGLRETARSIESQIGAEFQWVVVDGASSDGSQQFLVGHSRLTALISEPDGGIYDAMRKGLALATTDYVLFLNAGDVFHDCSSLSAALATLASDDVYFFDTVVESVGTSWRRAARPLSAARYSVPAIQQSTIYRVASLKQLSWPVTYKICGDYCLAAQLLAGGASASVKHLVLTRFHLGGVSTYSVVGLSREAHEIQKIYLSLPMWKRQLDFVRRLLTGLVVMSLHRFQCAMHSVRQKVYV